ncbi:MAG: M1 family metallopeptidase [Bacteroidota bacterium]
MKKLTLLVAILSLAFSLHAQVAVYDSGGPLMPEQAAYDVDRYDLTLQVFPEKQSIEGKVKVTAKVVQPMHYLVLDLDPVLELGVVSEIKDGKTIALPKERKGGKIWIDLKYTRQSGETIVVEVPYGGKPRVAPRPPWDGGFQWEKTSRGAHWIATSNQTNGADLWWPMKDHVSDEPNTMGLYITVPSDLVVATNGKMEKVDDSIEGLKTYHWEVRNPINAYNIALNIAPYVTLRSTLNSVAGEEVPVEFYVLPEDEEKGKKLLPEIVEHLEFYEKYLGPYPFRSDKYGVAQTPHLGMEHQTIIAYGANFSNSSMTRGTDWGFDALHHHELGHEWWGNLVTNYDWKDMWIHEGFCTYMQALYMEELKGKEAYEKYFASMRRFGNQYPVAQKETLSAKEIYKAPIYAKGAWVLNVLRYLVGDEDFFIILRRMCYPTPEMEKATDGSQTRFVTTEDFISLCEEVTGKELDWFFEVYIYQAELPILHSEIKGNKLSLKWEVANDLPFPMPVEVEIDGKIKRVDVPFEGKRTVLLKKGQKPVVNPSNMLLFEMSKAAKSSNGFRNTSKANGN